MMKYFRKLIPSQRSVIQVTSINAENFLNIQTHTYYCTFFHVQWQGLLYNVYKHVCTWFFSLFFWVINIIYFYDDFCFLINYYFSNIFINLLRNLSFALQSYIFPSQNTTSKMAEHCGYLSMRRSCVEP